MDIYQILRVKQNISKEELQAKYTRMFDTYQMTATFAEDSDVVRIAELKLDQLVKAGKSAGLVNEAIEKSDLITEQIEISTIKHALNSSKANVATINGNNISGKIDKLPDSAEKHYLKTIVLLRTGSSFENCKNALNEIQKAIERDSTNMAYIGLVEAINEQISDYENKQNEMAKAAEKERLERERKSREALEEAQRRQFWNSAGPCLSGVASLAITIGGCICCCNACCGECC